MKTATTFCKISTLAILLALTLGSRLCLAGNFSTYSATNTANDPDLFLLDVQTNASPAKYQTHSITKSNFLATAKFNGANVTNVTAMTNLNGAMIDPTRPPWNAAGDGVTDDTVAITNALLWGAQNGGIPVMLPGKSFKVTAPLVLYTNQSLFGMRGSRLYFGTGGSSPTTGWLTADYTSTNVHISGIEIDGGNGASIPGSDDGRTGLLIWADEQKNCDFHDIYVHGFGTGIRVFNLAGNQATKAHIHDLTCYYNYSGLKCDSGAEYVGYSGIYCFANAYGLLSYGGNNAFSSCHFTANNVNVAFNNAVITNPAHDLFSACTFNHPNTANILATNVNFGAVFSSCAFLAPGSSYFTNCQGFQFVNCMIGQTGGTAGFNFNGCTNCIVAFDQSPYAGGVGGTGISYSFTNCVNCFHLSDNNPAIPGLVLENANLTVSNGTLNVANIFWTDPTGNAAITNSLTVVGAQTNAGGINITANVGNTLTNAGDTHLAGVLSTSGATINNQANVAAGGFFNVGGTVANKRIFNLTWTSGTTYFTNFVTGLNYVFTGSGPRDFILCPQEGVTNTAGAITAGRVFYE